MKISRVLAGVLVGVSLSFGVPNDIEWSVEDIPKDIIKGTFAKSFIIKNIIEANNLKVKVEDNVKGTISVDFENKKLEEAFNFVVNNYDIDVKWKDDNKSTLLVFKKDEKSIVEAIQLKDINTSDLEEVLISLGKYNKFQTYITMNSSLNLVAIEAPTTEREEFKNLVKVIEEAKNLKDKEDKKKLEALPKDKLKEDDNLSKEDDSKMAIDLIPLKYINNSFKDMGVKEKDNKQKMNSLEDTLRGLLKTQFVDQNITSPDSEKAYLKIDERTNSIIIKDYPDRIAKIKEIVKKLDVEVDLIEIEVTIVSGTDGFSKQLGMRLGFTRKYNDGTREYGVSTSSSISDNLNQGRLTPSETSLTTNGNNFATTQTTDKSYNSDISMRQDQLQSVDLLQPLGALGLSSSMLYMGNRGILNFQLDALEENGVGKVLSNPHLVTLNHNEASIISGTSVSVPTATQDQMSLQQVDTGVSIGVTPHIITDSKENNDSNKDILLQIDVEKSSLGSVTNQQIEKAQNRIKTNVIIKSGQTLILGGLFDYTKSDSKGGVPILKDIPILDLFFSTKSKSLTKSELLFFITPKIIKSNRLDNREVTYLNNQKYFEYRDEIGEIKKEFNLFGKNRDKEYEGNTTLNEFQKMSIGE